MLDGFRSKLDVDIKQTEANILWMNRAVTASNKPGAIDYRQKVPEVAEVEKIYNMSSAVKSTLGMTVKGKSVPMGAESLKASSKVATFSDWFNAYGHPIRKSSKSERYLSRILEPAKPVPGSVSADRTVNFPCSKSSACKLIPGRLTK